MTTITLSDGAVTVTLDPDLKWTDEFTWSPVSHVAKYKLNGALSIHVSKKLAGRPITLAGADNYGWPDMTGAVVDQLRAWRDTPEQQLTLTLRGTAYSVMLRNNEPPALEAAPVVDYSDPATDDKYVVTIKLMVI